MNIAIIGSRGFPSTYGGYETAVRELAPRWSARGHKVTVYCRERPTAAWTWEVDGVTCQWTPGVTGKSTSTLSFGATGVLHASLTRSLRGCDVAIVLNIANGFWLPCLRWAEIPIVLNTDGVEWERGKWGPLARAVFKGGARAAARWADVLIADSREIGRVWEREFGVPSHFAPYGAYVREDVGCDRLRPLGLVPGQYILSVARLVPENNIELVLEAWIRGGMKHELVIVGSSGGDCGVERRLRGLVGTEKLLWLGHVADQELLEELWANCGVYVHGHSVGGTNPALLQALGLGAPTIALDTPYNREVLGEAAAKRVFHADPASLDAAIERTLHGVELRSLMAQEGRTIVAKRYAWDDVATSYIDGCKQAIESRKGAAGRE